MKGLQGSWGLVLDLDSQVPDTRLRELHQALWTHPLLQGPSREMGSFGPVPRACEGQLLWQGQALDCYSKWEQDGLGYPPGWDLPVVLSLNLYGLAQPLTEQPLLQAALLEIATALYALYPWRLALVGDVTSFYLNADMLHPSWFDFQQEAVLGLYLPITHPLTQQVAGSSEGLVPGLCHYGPDEMQPLWSHDDEQTRYLRYKQAISAQMHGDTAPPSGGLLEWERN